jgi:ABC-2 type transport system ATP-binding protein
MSAPLAAPEAPAVQRAAAPLPAVQLRSASRWYGNVVAVNDVSFDLGPGITGLLGPNGAGKSTLLHMMAGFLAPSAGTVHVDGAPIWGDPEAYRVVGLVPEREAVPAFLTAREFVHTSAVLQQLPDAKAATERALAAVDLLAVQDRRLSTFSKGMRQRAKVAAALVHDPRVLLLDVPFNGMDPGQRMHVMELLRRLAAGGRTVLISSHILEELHHLADNVLVVVAGRLAASGHFREIRRLMTDRPHTFTLRSGDDRSLAAALMNEPSVNGVEVGPGGLFVRAGDRGAFALALPRVARAAGISLHEVRPTDESLESVFSYLVRR